MHPTLGLQNLSQLGPSDRRLVTSAANGSLDAVREVVVLISADPDQLKACPSPIDSPILHAILSLKALSTRNADSGGLILVKEASPDVWPHVWKWVRLLDQYWEDLVDDHKETRDRIYATPGVHVVIARAWTIFLDKQSPEVDLGLLQGAGGSIADLARLLVAHLNFAVPSTDSPPSNETLLLLRGIIRLLKTINHRNEDWGSALLLQGIREKAKGGILDDCFFILAKILVVTPQHKYIAEALKAGLLQAIVLCFYYSVLSEINVELDKVRDLTQTPCFWASEIFQIWTTFVDSTETRLQVLRRYDNGESTRFRLLPMWSETSAINDGLEDIANSLPTGLELENSGYGPVVGHRVTALLKQDGCNAKINC
ncbi:hypothetical protein B0H10DRAFT_2208583 [Mycena sp. CBHHK59/15]|nr:hypothetical protein B0H10DRAFT_2208583 [Mycena sp. CBHHK59/15]